MKIIVLYLIIALFISINIFADGVEPDGSGTEVDPYQVEILDNLLWISTNSNSWDKHFIQLADINASDTQNWNNGEGFSPIGNEDTQFTGTYNGQESIVDSIYIYRTTNFVGLFGNIYTATLENLGVTNVNISGSCYIGGLAGIIFSSSTISNSYSTGNVSGDWGIGGLIGRVEYSSTDNSFSTASVNGTKWVGGLVGLNLSSVLSNSYYNYETVLINGENVLTNGALYNEQFIAWLDNNLFLNIDNYLSSNGEDYLISNIEDFKQLLAFGQFSEYSFLLQNDLNLSNENNFYIPYFSGCFNGNNLTITNLNLDMESYILLGLFGYTNNATIENLAVTNIDILGDEFVGGLVGVNDYSSTISNSYTTGSISGNGQIGGLVGANSHSTINNSYSTSSINGNNFIGGLIGNNVGSSTSNSYSTGNVVGNLVVGGFMGHNWDSSVINSYSKGIVNGNNKVGGFVGWIYDYSTINKCYSIGSVSGDGDNVGGLAGDNDNYFSTVENSFWNVETSGQTTSAGGTGKTTAEMQDVATYTSLVTVGLDEPWDFVNNPFDDIGNEDYWDIDDEINDGYPYLANPLVSIKDETIIEVTNVSKLIGNYPNPFNPSTSIEFSINNNSHIELSIYNIKGQKIKTLAQNEFTKGSHSIIWNGDEESGKSVSSGVYLYKLNVNDKIEAVKRCLLLK